MVTPNELVRQTNSALKIKFPISDNKDTLKLNKRSTSVLQKVSSDKNLLIKITGQDQVQNSSDDLIGGHRLKVLLPKVSSKKDLKLESLTPLALPVIPFPRVIGKEVVSPFKRQGSITTGFLITQGDEDNEQPPAESFQRTMRSSTKIGQLMALREKSQTQLALTGQFFNKPSELKLFKQPNDKSIEIHQMIQKKRFLKEEIQPDKVTTTQQNPPKLKVVRKKHRVEVREYMIAKGLQPTPLEFYKLVTNDTQIQDFFCYCNRKSDFYDFEIVSFDEKDEDDYLTVSKRGVVHFLRSEPNFMPILQWEKESQTFKSIKKISFFQNFKYWKTFLNWKSIMRRTMFSKTSEFLRRELFILDAELSKPLLDIRMRSYEIQRLQVVSLHQDNPTDHVELDSQQEKQRKYLKDKLNKIQKDIQQDLTDSCNLSMRTFKEENRIAITDDFFGGEEEKICQEAFLVGDETHKQMPYTQEATLKTQFKRLSKFIRLTDFQVLDGRYKLIYNTFNFICDTLKLDFSQSRKHLVGNRVQTSALFQITVDYKEGELIYTPEWTQIRDSIQNAVVQGVDSIKEYVPYLNQQQYERYAKAQDHDEIFIDQNDLLTIAIGPANFRDEKQDISRILQFCFEQVVGFTRSYNRYLKLYRERYFKFNVEDYKNCDQEQFQCQLKKLDKHCEEIEKMDVRNTINIFKIDGEDLKTHIKDKIYKSKYALKAYIPKVQFDRLQEIFVCLDKDFSKISRRPRMVDEYVSLMNHLREITETMDKYSTDFHEAEQLLQLMDEHKIQNPERNRTKIRETQTLLLETKKAMVEAFESSQQYKLEFKKELIEGEIPKVKRKIDQLREQLTHEGVFESEDTPVEQATLTLDMIGQDVKQVKERGQQLNQYQRFLDVDETPFAGANEVFEDWQTKFNLWSGIKLWGDSSKNWLKTPFSEINVEELSTKVDNYFKMASLSLINMKGNKMAQVFKDKVEALKSTIPIVTYLRDESLQDKHWEEISKIINLTKQELSSSSFQLSSLLELNVMQYKVKLEEIALKANQEKDLEQQYEKITSEWRKATFDTKQHKDQYYILLPSEQLNTLLEESLSQLSKMLSCRFIPDNLKINTEVLYKKIQYLENLLNKWFSFQQTWMYLENIFSGEIDSKIFGGDYSKFTHVDTIWRDIMRGTHNNPSVQRVLAGYKIDQAHMLKMMNQISQLQSAEINYLVVLSQNFQELNKIQQSLDKHLDQRRKEFPRLYFLSNDELLHLMSHGSKNPKSVEIHLRKLFESLVKIGFDSDSTDEIIQFESPEGEILKLMPSVKCGNNISVQSWLSSLHDSMINLVMKSTKEAKAAFKEDSESFKRSDWVMEDYPAQSISLVASIQWCKETENILQQDDDDYKIEDFDLWFQENVSQLNQLTKIITRQSLELKKRRCLIALITQDVHYRDITEELMKLSFTTSISTSDFIWQKQLRYYYDDTGIQVRQVNASFKYGNEYLGATTRIVITPLTDRCWLTITGALHLKLGAAPSGPAGTGKTESTKDLSKALGKYCVVFNCSDQINFKMMESLFIGLAMSGSWACLDEFNRINIEVLSVIAQLVLDIRHALIQGKKEKVRIGDKTLDKFYDTLGIFITMNPGYKGRTELPDNLKVLFRPVSMMIPDYTLIAEIMLFSEGFSNGKQLSKKMTKLYKLSSEQLSQQSHYDFGMRAVKSVLTMAGQLKRNNPKVAEDILLIRAMKDSNIPKFLKEDLPLFNAIIKDLFPNCTVELQRDQDFIKAIGDVQIQLGLTPSEQQTEKIMQLKETLGVRFGLMIIGQTLTGKSTLIKSLKYTLKSLENQGIQGVKSHILNPKSVSLTELYGNFSHITQEWTDGLASQIFRKCVEIESTKAQWVVFDGPVDAIWVENLNTVLDDNMTLCLSNGERIKLRPDMRVIFEIDDLSQASPATVSRCGMVYANSQSLTWRSIVSSWLLKLDSNIFNDKAKEHLWNLFDTHMDNTFEQFSIKNYEQPIAQVNLGFVRSLCRLIQSILTHDIPLSQFSLDRQKKVVTRTFTYAFAWTFGGSIDCKNHSSFEVYLGNALQSMQNEIPRTTIFDNCLYTKAPGTKDMSLEFQLWDSIIPQINLQELKNASFESQYEIVVPTKDTIRYQWLIKMNLMSGFPVFLTGVSGVGKSLICSSVLQTLLKTLNYQVINLSFSSQSSAVETQKAIEDKLDKKRRTILASSKNTRVVVFIDDVNMPSYDKYGTQMPIELLRQLLDYHGMYDLDERYWKTVEDMTFLCAAAPPEGGRKILSQRFTSQFHMLCMPPTQEDSLQKIFGTILFSHYSSQNGFRKEVLNQTQRLSESTLLLFIKVTENLKPTPQRQLYNFNLRDIQRVITSLCSVKSPDITSVEKLAKLWVHENCRVYLDRLVSDDDREWFKNQVILTLQGSLRFDSSYEEIFNNQKIIFCDFLQRGLSQEDRHYQLVTKYDKFLECLQDYVDEYNITYPTQTLSIVLFDHCIEQIIKICRALRHPQSHVLIVGISGSGKQTLTRLSSFISLTHFKTVQSKNRITQSEFRQSLKESLLIGGIKKQRVAFMLTDYHMNAAAVNNDMFLEDCSNLINHGEIANLWTPEDKEEIFRSIQYEAKEVEIYDKETIVSGFFVQRMKYKFHFILCMSPLGDSFRNRVRMFPSLINSCQIIWFQDWPEEALFSVGTKLFQKVHSIKDENIIPKLATVAFKLNELVIQEAKNFYNHQKRKVYLTASSYIEFLKCFQSLMEKKCDQIAKRRNTLMNGCVKLQKTNEIVIQLTKNMVEMQPKLKEAILQAEKTSRILQIENQQAIINEKLVEDTKHKLKIQTDESEKEQKEAQDELDKVLPSLREAEDALNQLNQSDITELRQTKFPSTGILLTMIMTCILLEKREDIKKIDWRICQQMMQVGFFEKLKTFNKEEYVENEKLQSIVEKFKDDHMDFNPEKVKNASKACYSLCKWCFSLINYAKIAKLVLPKQREVDVKKVKVHKLQKELAIKQTELLQEKMKRDQLEKQFNRCIEEREELENEIELSRQRIERSSRMINGLKGENERWKECLKQLDEEDKFTIGEIFIATATINYLGPFTGQYRKRVLEGLRRQLLAVGIPIYSETKGIDEILKDPIEIQNWILCSLPSDTVSITNGVIVTNTIKVPLIIDPQLQALRWLKILYKQQNSFNSVALYETRLGASDFRLILEEAIKNGKTVLIEDVPNQLDSLLDPLLLQSQFKGPHGRILINFANEVIDFDTRFKLYLSTRDPNPHLLPEITMKVTVVNFTVTEDGLSEQLLSEIVRLENAELELRRQVLSNSIVQDQIKMIRIQEEILSKLVNSSETTILDDEDLIIYLDKSKLTNQDIKIGIDQKREAQVEIAEQRGIYDALAERGSILYFTIIDLARIERMYQYSLEQFKSLFISTIKQTETYDTPKNKRIAILMKEITKTLYLNVYRGLFNEDRLIFAMMLSVKIKLNQKTLSIQEWDFFIKGLSLSASNNQKQPTSSKMLSEKHWKYLVALESCHANFQGITKLSGEWEKWQSLQNQIEMPGEFEIRLSSVQKLMVVKGLREHNLIESINVYLRNELGQEYVQIRPTNLENAFLDSDNKTPIIFILQKGADPTASFEKLFLSHNGNKSQNQNELVFRISLGQGQEIHTKTSLEKAQLTGAWVLLQNCHLFESYMPTLESHVLSMQEKSSDIHQDFRLFLTSIPCEFFPTSILQSSVKISFETARGIKANILNSVAKVTAADTQTHPQSEQQASKYAKLQLLSYSLCFFHAIVQERRKFGPLGWNIRYEFNESDLDTGLTVIRDMMGNNARDSSQMESDDIPWASMQEVIGDVVYGGRVTDEIDRRTLKTILKNFITEDILDETYSYYQSCYRPIGRISCCNFSADKEEILAFPENDHPEIFGMTHIADLNYSVQESHKLIDSLLLLYNFEGSSKQENNIGELQTKDKEVENFANEIESQLPKPLSREGSNKELFTGSKDGVLPSMTVFLLHEIERYNNLVKVMAMSIDTLKKALKGLAVMSEDIEKMQMSIYNNKVPELWANKAYPSLKPLSSWFQNLNERFNFLRKWLKKGNKLGGFWISSFFFPQGFLTSVLQNYARKSKSAIDSLTFGFEVLPFINTEELPQAELDRPVNEGVLIYGLFTTSGLINLKSGYLDEDPADFRQYHEAPIILFRPLPESFASPSLYNSLASNKHKEEEKEPIVPEMRYSCPLYKTSERAGTLSTTGHSTNYIISIDLPTVRNPEHWILRGTALLCQLDD